MKATRTGGLGWTWLGALALAFALGGCMPSFREPLPPPPPPAPPPPPQVSRPVFYVAGNRVNLRACPGMDCPKISVLERNEEVEKVGDTDDWSQIRVKRDGRLGWVTSRYLSAQPLPAAPEVTTPPPPPPPSTTVTPPPLPERPAAAEKPKPTEAPAPPKKKPEEARPPKPAKPPKTEEEAEPAPRKPKPEVEKPAPEKKEKPAPSPEKPAPPPEPAPEQPGKRIRIM